MTNKITVSFSLLGSLFLLACNGADDGKIAGVGRRGQALIAKGECTFASCSSVPSSLKNAPTVQCSGSVADSCDWSAVDEKEQAASYRHCQDSECPPRPVIDCLGNTVTSEQQCGAENSAGCVWTTTCVPPRQTTPCPKANGCHGQPRLEILVICKDGSTGDFVCVTDSAGCFLERSCD